jgi:phosphopantetheinyl transferase
MTPVGIDIERIRDRIDRVAGRFLSDQEAGWVREYHRLEKLHICWGAKESLYKLNGKANVDIKTDIELEQFEYFCSENGVFRATMKTPEGTGLFTIRYSKIEDYMLVYATDQ